MICYPFDIVALSSDPSYVSCLCHNLAFLPPHTHNTTEGELPLQCEAKHPVLIDSKEKKKIPMDLAPEALLC